MGISANFNNGDINDYIRQQSVRIEKAIIANLQRIGEEFLMNVRSQDTYKDQTGNLRASCGYFVLKDGVVIVGNTGSVLEGANAAKDTLSLVTKKGGYQLVGVAGMGYAAYVESRGLNVITSQSMIAIENLAKAMKRLSGKTGLNLGVE